MKGTFIDFLEFLNENEDLRKDVVAVASKHGFEFSDEVSDAELDAVAGGIDTTFENFDQKSSQVNNILASVLKSTKDMQASVTRNIL